MSARWHISDADGNHGPITDERLAELVANGTLRPNTLVWCHGFKKWKATGEIPELLLPSGQPQLPHSNATSPEIPVPMPKLKIDIDDIPITGVLSYNTSRRSYISRHWRGELSLPVSYWINYFFATVAVFVLASCFGLLISPTYSPIGFATAASVAWLFFIAATLWQLVGVWRSAGKHKKRGGKGFWAGAARVMVILGFLSLAGALSEQTYPQLKESWSIAVGDPEMGRHELHILRGGTELEYIGGITFGATEEVRKLLDADPAIRVIHLNSPGGRVAEARELRDLIRQRGVATYTATICASACTIAFMGGAKRFLGPDAKLGFHRGSFPGVTDEQLAQENDVDRRALVEEGVSPWFADRAYSTPNDSMWWPTTRELTQAGIVTDIATPDDFALSGGSRTVTERDLDKSLQENPLYVAIKSSEPEIYGKILRAVIDAVSLGSSEAELATVARPYISALSKKYLPVASDDAVISTAQLAIFEAEAIGFKSSDACYEYFYPQPGSKPVILSEYLSAGAQQRDLAITTAVIVTGSANPQHTPTKNEIYPLLKVVISKLLKKYPSSDIAVIGDARAAAANHQAACRMFDALFREVLTLPRTDAVRLLRYLFAQ